MTKRTSRKKALLPRSTDMRHLQRHVPAVFTPLNFKVSQEFHREFKMFAAQHSKKMVEVLHEAFALLKDKYGS